MRNTSIYLKKTADSFAKIYYAELVSLMSLTVISIILGRVLDAEALGIYSISFITATLFRMFAESGYELEILREISTDRKKVYPIVIEAQELKNFLLTATIPIMLIYFYFSVSDISCLLMIPYNYLSSITITYKSVLRGIKSYTILSKIESIYAITLLLFSVVAIYTTRNIAYVMLVYVIMELFKIFLLYRELKKEKTIEIPKFYLMFQLHATFYYWKKQIEIIKKRKPLMIINMSSVLQNRAGFYMLGIVGTNAQKGIYSAAYRFISFLRTIPWALINVLLPDYAEKLKKSENANLGAGLIISFIIGFIISLTLWLLSDFLIELTYKFEEAKDLLKILSFSFVAIMLNTVCETYLIALKKETYANIAMLLSVAFSFVGTLILYGKFGNYGVAYTFLFSEYFLFLIYIILVLIHSPKSPKNI